MGREGFEQPCRSHIFFFGEGTGGGTFCARAGIPDAFWRA